MPKYLLLGIPILMLFSCVSTKKYKLLEAENLDQSNRIEKLEFARERGEVAAQDRDNCSQQLRQAENLLKEVNANYNGLKSANASLQTSYDDLLKQNVELLNVTSQEKSKLTSEINKKQEELDAKERMLAERQERIKVSEDKIASLESLLSREKLRMDSLQNSISNALFVFGPSDLSVVQKEGKIYVSLSQKLLFSKGSDVIDKNGVNALSKLAEVLRERQDIDIIVEGHTDPDGNAEQNWDLSTKRATSVVKLLQKSGVPPNNLTASGRALYDPIAANDSEINKGKNRRTEIILSPKLDQIMELIRT